jgi:hypothetical protein
MEEHPMRSILAAGIFLLIVSGPAGAGKVEHNKRCLVEVVHSEELPVGLPFYHTVRATLLVTAPNALPAETTVYKMIPWQVPPPRQGQKVWMRCNKSLSMLRFDFSWPRVTP